MCIYIYIYIYDTTTTTTTTTKTNNNDNDNDKYIRFLYYDLPVPGTSIKWILRGPLLGAPSL